MQQIRRHSKGLEKLFTSAHTFEQPDRRTDTQISCYVCDESKQ